MRSEGVCDSFFSRTAITCGQAWLLRFESRRTREQLRDVQHGCGGGPVACRCRHPVAPPSILKWWYMAPIPAPGRASALDLLELLFAVGNPIA